MCQIALQPRVHLKQAHGCHNPSNLHFDFTPMKMAFSLICNLFSIFYFDSVIDVGYRRRKNAEKERTEVID